MAFREVPQRIAHAQQDFRFRVRLHRGQQGFIVVEVEAARAAVGDQPVGHVDQRRALAPQVVGQQGVEAPMRGVAVKGAERGAERLFVKRQRLHRVARRSHVRGRRRGEDRLGGRLAAVDVVRLEQFDGQVRNLLRRAHLFGADARECEILPVGGACGGLTAECLQGRPGESRVVRDAEYVVWGDHFHKDTNKRGQKQVYLHFAEREYLKDSAME